MYLVSSLSAHKPLLSHWTSQQTGISLCSGEHQIYIYSEKITTIVLSHPRQPMTDIILQLCNIMSVDTIHSFHVRGHYSFLSLLFSRGPLLPRYASTSCLQYICVVTAPQVQSLVPAATFNIVSMSFCS